MHIIFESDSQVGFFGNGVGADEHPVGADADRAGAPFRGSYDTVRQNLADAVKFGAMARPRRK
jgi:hypothetical protein